MKYRETFPCCSCCPERNHRQHFSPCNACQVEMFSKWQIKPDQDYTKKGYDKVREANKAKIFVMTEERVSNLTGMQEGHRVKDLYWGSHLIDRLAEICGTSPTSIYSKVNIIKKEVLQID